MKPKTLTSLFFLIPFVATVLNLQAFASLYISESMAQLIAYVNLVLLILGILFSLRKCQKFSKTAGLWTFFYLIYYSFGTVAVVLHGNPTNILVSIIPVIYFFSFYVYLSNPQNIKLFTNVALVSFVASSMLCIYLFKINWSLDFGGVWIYKVERAGGVFGDANNAALVAIIAFILVYKLYTPSKNLFKYFKIILLLALFYCLAITFSTTGFVVFITSFIMLNHSYFTKKRILLSFILLPIFYFTLINLNNITSGLDLAPDQRFKINNIVNLLTFNTDEVNNSGRSELLENLLVYVYKNPIFGNGIDFAASIRGHNTIVGIWADAGIFALVIFLVLLSTYFIKAIKSPPNIRFFTIPILLTMCIFMLSLQTVINQGYLIALFVYIGYLLDRNELSLQ